MAEETIRSKTKVFEELKRQFVLSDDVLQNLVNQFLKEIKDGLQGKPSSFKMIPSFVSNLPGGSEKGDFYGIDMGGTNFRAACFRFSGDGKCAVVDEKKATIPEDIRTTTDGGKLFDFFADVIYNLEIEEHKSVKNFGFTFSFPVHQTALDHGELITWTKGFKVGGVEGEDVVGLLRDALGRKKTTLKGTSADLEADVKVLINDTVGTLAAGRYEHPDCVMGIILGTGTNVAYLEKSANILKLDEKIRNQSENMVINVEWGAFGDHNGCLPSTLMDDRINEISTNVNEQQFEKMISGYYLGEVVRQFCVELITHKEIFSDPATVVGEKFFKPHILDSSYMSALDPSQDHATAETGFTSLCEELEISNATTNDLIILRDICGVVILRAAKLTACGITALMKQIREREVSAQALTAGIDGSVYEHHPTFKHHLQKTLSDLGTSCNIRQVKDGSGKGAALLAGVLPQA